MSYVIVGSCVNDGSCVDVCPVDCIHPTPQTNAYHNAEMLYINPAVCVDCNACAETCPIDAIYPVQKLPEKWAEYAEINAAYFRQAGQQ